MRDDHQLLTPLRVIDIPPHRATLKNLLSFSQVNYLINSFCLASTTSHHKAIAKNKHWLYASGWHDKLFTTITTACATGLDRQQHKAKPEPDEYSSNAITTYEKVAGSDLLIRQENQLRKPGFVAAGLCLRAAVI